MTCFMVYILVCVAVAGDEEVKESEKKKVIDLGREKGKGKLKKDLSSAESAVSSEDDSEASDSSSESSCEDEGSLCDLYLPSSGVPGGWREEEDEDSVPLSEETSHRVAVCNMDWDHVGAMDIFG